MLALGSAFIIAFTPSLPARADAAPEIVTTLNSPDCPGSAHWHMALLEFFADANGTTLPRDKGMFTLISLGVQQFLDGIATASDCGVTADIDIWDMGASIYPVADEPPSATLEEYLAKGYDVVMYRYPDHLGKALTYIGRAHPRWIEFPVPSAWAQDTSVAIPNINVLWHEWLHEAVFNAGDRSLDQGLPPNDVHYLQITKPARTLAEAMQFLSDLTGGKVLIDGKYYGFTKADWIRLGTPTHPKNLIGTIQIYSGWLVAGTGHLALHVDNPVFSITLKGRGKNAWAITPSFTPDESGTSIRFPLQRDSRWNVCVTTKNSSDGHWAGARYCEDVSFIDVTPKPASTLLVKPSAKAITILCTKGKLSVKVTGLKPKCPNGYSHK